jgi:hypothetical protein
MAAPPPFSAPIHSQGIAAPPSFSAPSPPAPTVAPIVPTPRASTPTPAPPSPPISSPRVSSPASSPRSNPKPRAVAKRKSNPVLVLFLVLFVLASFAFSALLLVRLYAH